MEFVTRHFAAGNHHIVQLDFTCLEYVGFFELGCHSARHGSGTSTCGGEDGVQQLFLHPARRALLHHDGCLKDGARSILGGTRGTDSHIKSFDTSQCRQVGLDMVIDLRPVLVHSPQAIHRQIVERHCDGDCAIRLLEGGYLQGGPVPSSGLDGDMSLLSGRTRSQASKGFHLKSCQWNPGWRLCTTAAGPHCLGGEGDAHLFAIFLELCIELFIWAEGYRDVHDVPI
mmetsp:Transcript_42251/g.91280  ORF Transcript_42251/g.91280 Transcript_42251/m.91280 type:complete len:228 (+) Transcript_42251:1918-2601(+)